MIAGGQQAPATHCSVQLFFKPPLGSIVSHHTGGKQCTWT